MRVFFFLRFQYISPGGVNTADHLEVETFYTEEPVLKTMSL
jgi:hypothetical protein